MTREEAIKRIREAGLGEALGVLVPELNESEDEKVLRIIRKRMCYDPVPISDEDRRIVENWLEKKKEQKPELCDMGKWDEESYNNGIHHVLQNPEAYGLTKQKPAEWSKEDERCLIKAINIVVGDYGEDCDIARWLNSLPERINPLPERINPQPKQELEEVAGVVHHTLNTHWVVTDKEQLAAVLKKFPEGANVKIMIAEEEESK